jgi:hypothetical protein
MRLTIFALAMAASGLALTPAAGAPGGHGGGTGLGHMIGGGGGGPMAAGGLAGGIGPGMSGQAHIGGGAPGLGPSAASGGAMSGGLGPGMGASFRGSGRLDSQGPFNASATGAAHASDHSVLSGVSPVAKARDDHDDEAAEHARAALTPVTSVSSGTLSGLADAQTVKTSSGATVGTVSKILVNASGAPVAVVVTQANGEKIRLPASSLSLANNVVTTTSKRAAHEAAETAEENPHPTSITSGTFAGLAVGDSVVSAHGKTLGTISRITVSDAGTLRTVMVTTASGKHFAVPARDVSVSGSTVTLTKAMVTAHG